MLAQIRQFLRKHNDSLGWTATWGLFPTAALAIIAANNPPAAILPLEIAGPAFLLNFMLAGYFCLNARS